jgi:hypothetical protein
MLLKPLLTCLLNTVIYGIVLPIAVYILADNAIELSCKYYWGEEYLKSDSGFKLGIWVTFYFITLTLYYYLFAFISFAFKHKLRPISIAITIFMPIVFHYDMSDYDYRITVCFTGFHLTYYVLFYLFVWVQKWFNFYLKNMYSQQIQIDR